MRPSPGQTGFTAWVEHLARDQANALVATAVREGLTSDEAMDAVQEAFATFLGLPQARTLAEHREDAGAFLAVIVRNAARNARRRHHRARPHTDIEDQAVLDELPTAATLIAAAEEHIAMLGCVRKLGEIQRAVVTLRVIEEVSGPEASQQLGLSPGYIAVQLHRAKQALQLCMAE
jgi:RNA polymerase sigma-70 factor, ECF subfamily